MPYLVAYILEQHKKELSKLKGHEVAAYNKLKQQFDTLLDFDSLNFSTLVVYTCEHSCTSSAEGGFGYVEEFAYVQPPM